MHRERVDFRMDISGLSSLVEQAMSLNPMAQATRCGESIDERSNA
ncbi:hypothetical protein [Paraburkholderia sp. GAS41]